MASSLQGKQLLATMTWIDVCISQFWVDLKASCRTIMKVGKKLGCDVGPHHKETNYNAF